MKHNPRCEVVIPSYVKTVVKARDYGPEFGIKRQMLRTGRGLKRGTNASVIGPCERVGGTLFLVFGASRADTRPHENNSGSGTTYVGEPPAMVSETSDSRRLIEDHEDYPDERFRRSVVDFEDLPT